MSTMDDERPDTGATQRDWTGVILRAQFDKVIPGTRPGKYIKASNVVTVAVVIASYADPDGTRVFPGVARLAADCKLGYSVVSRVVVGLRDLGLIERVRRGVRRNPRSVREQTDEYRLTIPEDLLERLFVPTPSNHRERVAVIAKPHRRRRQPTSRAESDSGDPDTSRATSDPGSADESKAALDTSVDESKAAFCTDLSASQTAATYTHDPYTSTTSHPDQDVSEDAAATRAPEIESEDPNLGGGVETARPSLRVVAGGGQTTPTQPALWPVAVPPPAVADAPAVPVRPATARQAAIAAMRQQVADARQAVKHQGRKRCGT